MPEQLDKAPAPMTVGCRKRVVQPDARLLEVYGVWTNPEPTCLEDAAQRFEFELRVPHTAGGKGQAEVLAVAELYRIPERYFANPASIAFLTEPSHAFSEINDVMDMDVGGRIKYRTTGGRDLNSGGAHGPILYIEKLQLLDARFRGQGYGVFLACRAIEMLATRGEKHPSRTLVLPFPLQWQPELHVDVVEGRSTFEDDKKRVVGVWESMGFQKIGDSDIWGRSECADLPNAKDICKFIAKLPMEDRPIDWGAHRDGLDTIVVREDNEAEDEEAEEEDGQDKETEDMEDGMQQTDSDAPMESSHMKAKPAKACTRVKRTKKSSKAMKIKRGAGTNRAMSRKQMQHTMKKTKALKNATRQSGSKPRK